tara:strand:- start:243 stop:1220 length:978 start_codon:yes stop_codon:yes gene_type:complete
MTFNKYLNKSNKIFNKVYKSYIKLNFITKLFIFFFILLFTICILNKNKQFNQLENFDTLKKRYEIKRDKEIYDEFYTNHYDNIITDKYRHDYEFNKLNELNIIKNNDKILDIGSSTGYTTNLFNEYKYNIIGLDQSEHMIKYAKGKYPKSKFKLGNIIDTKLFELNYFNIILCLGKTIYEIPEIHDFFDKCYNLLSEDGYLILHLVNEKKFNPHARKNIKINNNNNSNFKKIKTDNGTYESEYKVINDKSSKNDNTTINSPYSQYIEKFTNTSNGNIRKNIKNMYMPQLIDVNKIAESKHFKYLDVIKLKIIDYKDEFIYIYKKN